MSFLAVQYCMPPGQIRTNSTIDTAKYEDSALMGYDAPSLVIRMKEKLFQSSGANSEVAGRVT